MGSYQKRTSTGQADTQIKYLIEDEETGAMIAVTLICSCDLPVGFYVSGYFYCNHCDYFCFIDKCEDCATYNYGVDDRLIIEDERD